MARNTVVLLTDDLVGVQVEDENEIRMDVPVVFDGQETTLDLIPTTYEALRALMFDKDAHGVRMVFASNAPVKRTREELDAIRHAAREAGMDVKDTGRPSKEVLTWYDNVYLPSTEVRQTENNTGDGENTGEADADADTAPAAAAPRKTSRKS